MDEHLDFATFLSERMKERGFSAAKLSEASGIAPEHLTHFIRSEFELLPSAPYVRGYLDKLGRVLEFDAAFWWDEFKREERVSRSGKTDELAKNRFAHKSLAMYLWSGGALVLLLLIYLGIRLPSALAHPQLIVDNPQDTVTRTAEAQITVSGTSEDMNEVHVNTEPVPVENGNWSIVLPLQSGLNTIEISARKLLGGETKLIRQVVYEPPIPVSTSTPQATSSPATTPSPEE